MSRERDAERRFSEQLDHLLAGEDIEKVKIGQKCRIKIPSQKNEVFTGAVYSKNLAADPFSKTFKVEIKIDNPDMKIKPGLFADISIEVFNKKDALILPMKALLNENQVIVFDNGKARYVTVTVGERNNSVFEILTGVKEGELVLVEGNYDLKAGSPIAIKGETK